MEYIINSLSAIAGTLALAAFVPYLFDILRGKTKPVLATWVMFSAVNILALWGLITTDEPTSLFVPMGFAIGAIATLLATVFTAEDKHFSVVDILCLCVAGIGVIAMIVTKDGMTAVYASLFAMAVGAIPTLVHAWNAPHEESPIAWAMFGISAVCNAGYPGNWETFEKFIYPMVIAIINIPIMLIMLRAKVSGRI